MLMCKYVHVHVHVCTCLWDFKNLLKLFTISKKMKLLEFMA